MGIAGTNLITLIIIFRSTFSLIVVSRSFGVFVCLTLILATSLSILSLGLNKSSGIEFSLNFTGKILPVVIESLMKNKIGYQNNQGD